MSPSATAVAPKKELNSFVRNEPSGPVEYKVGDTVLIKSQEDSDQYPFIGVIKALHEPSSDASGAPTRDMTVNWYYRPNEVIGGRKHFHGAMEVFESDHSDTVDVSTIISHCDILSLDDYLDTDQVTPSTFFTRYFYSARRKEFKPDRVMVYCTCQLPYNPDLPMVMCEQCEEWYHLECLGVSPIDPPLDRQRFTCSACAMKQDAATS